MGDCGGSFFSCGEEYPDHPVRGWVHRAGAFPNIRTGIRLDEAEVVRAAKGRSLMGASSECLQVYQHIEYTQ